jgi:hypothetical protein
VTKGLQTISKKTPGLEGNSCCEGLELKGVEKKGLELKGRIFSPKGWIDLELRTYLCICCNY